MFIGSFFNIKLINDYNLFFVSGRIALKTIINKLMTNNDKCLIPDYLCESIFKQFTNFDFYNINDDFNINIKDLLEKINLKNYKLIYIINYFGRIDKNINYIKKICNDKNIIILEDYTHNLYSKKLYGDICLCSYRKSIESPYGCIVKDHKKILNINQKIKFNFKYLFVNILKILIMILKNNIYFKSLFFNINNYLENEIDNLNYAEFDYINYFFFKMCFNAKNILKKKKNFNYLKSKIKIKPIVISNSFFTYPILFNSEKERDEYKNYLVKNNIYCFILWPMEFNNNKLSKKILCIPIDQRYNLKHMNYISKIINIRHNS